MQRHPDLARAIALSAAGRNAEALLIIGQQVARNNPDAMAMMAELRWRGGMVPQDPLAARELYRRASDAGHANAGAVYTNLLASGIAGPRYWGEAIQRLDREAEKYPARQRIKKLIDQMRLTEDGDPTSLPTGELLSGSPEVTLYPRLFTRAECEYLAALATPLFAPSTVNDAMGRPVLDQIRTSDGSTIHWMIEDPAVHALNRRIAALTPSPAENGEALQILRYRTGQQYRPHYDFVRASENQRHLTALVWLNEDYQGGETHFLKTGLKVKGKRGDCIVFKNSLPDRSVDRMSEHAGMPVIVGMKLLASRWIRESRWAP
jgi:prolyl 4-hydroxylase